MLRVASTRSSEIYLSMFRHISKSSTGKPAAAKRTRPTEAEEESSNLEDTQGVVDVEMDSNVEPPKKKVAVGESSDSVLGPDQGKPANTGSSSSRGLSRITSSHPRGARASRGVSRARGRGGRGRGA